jgi:dipeptidyl-peptidase-3
MASNRARVPDQASPIHRLVIKPLFDSLPPRDKLYAHYLSQAAWHGARIVLRQTSLESEDIFDFIMKAYRACEGDWSQFEEPCAVTDDEVKALLSYAGLFTTELKLDLKPGKLTESVGMLIVHNFRRIRDRSS